MYSDEEAFRAFSEATNQPKVAERQARVLRELSGFLRRGSTMPRLLDVGAGSGGFLHDAREVGFDVYGNELSSEGIDQARRTYGIELSPRVLEEEERDGFFDAVTMWGVLEHVPEPMSLLQSAFRVLRDGGILFLYTPTWCLYDAIGLRLAQVSHNRWTVLLDRRISEEHLQLYPMRALRAACKRIGFEMIREETVSEYNFKTAAYLESMGVPGALRRTLAAALDGLIDHGLFFRNNARIYCHKPDRTTRKM